MARVVLRPFRADEFGVLWIHAVTPTQHGDRNAKRRFRRHFDKVLATGRFNEGVLQLAIEVEGRLVGDVQARQPQAGLPPGVFELGIAIYDPADRGHGAGARAVELITERLFADEGAGRVQASTAVGHGAMRHVLEKLGFGFEGILRGFMPTDGELREDYAMYGVTREDWLGYRRAKTS